MAIFHFNAKIIKRSAGHSATAAAAYCSADCVKDERLKTTFDYRNKCGVVYSEIVVPENAPAWGYNRERLWNKAEHAEKRKDSQVAREITLALPKELTLDQQKSLLIQFVQTCFVTQGMIADFSIHHDNPDNPHAHILLTLRKLEGDSFGEKVREWNNSKALIGWREKWANVANQHLQNVGHNQQINHRSHADRGLKQKPTLHLGHKNYYALKFRQKLLDRALVNEAIVVDNAALSAQRNTERGSAQLLGQVGLFRHGMLIMLIMHDEELQNLEEEVTCNDLQYRL